MYNIIRFGIIALAITWGFLRYRAWKKKNPNAFAPTLLSLKKKPKMYIIRKAIGNIAIFWACVLVVSLPVENLFLRFSSPLDSYNYTKPINYKIIDIKECGDSAVVISIERNGMNYIFLQKDKRGWLIDNPCVTGFDMKTVFSDGFMKGLLIQYRHINSDVLFISFNVGVSRDKPALVHDSANTKFNLYQQQSNFDFHYTTYYAYVVGAKDYILSINGKEIQIE